ncbi:hypothetical protein [Pedobacter lusitanus]|nr:hypothetical protein [Pedobacter lusitanus]
MAHQFLYGILFIGLLNICQESKAQAPAAQQNKIINSVTAMVSGDESKNIKASGEEDVSLGFLKFTKTSVGPITIGGTVKGKDGTSYKAFFVMPLNLQTGVEQKGGFGSYVIENDTETKTYSTTLYQTFFDTDSQGGGSNVKVTLSEVAELKDQVKVTGKFHFNAAYDPDPESEKGKEPHEGYPLINGAVRGSKKVAVSGTFTVYLIKILRD